MKFIAQKLKPEEKSFGVGPDAHKKTKDFWIDPSNFESDPNSPTLRKKLPYKQQTRQLDDEVYVPGRGPVEWGELREFKDDVSPPWAQEQEVPIEELNTESSGYENPVETDDLDYRGPPIYKRDDAILGQLTPKLLLEFNAQKEVISSQPNPNWTTDSGYKNLSILANKATEEEIRHFGGWYYTAHDQAKRWAETYSYPLTTVAAVIAVLSPQEEWESNLANAEAALRLDYNEIRGMVSNREKVRRLLEENDLSVLNGPKVMDFYLSILDPKKYENRVVRDTHAINAWRGMRVGSVTDTGGIPNVTEWEQLKQDYARIAADMSKKVGFKVSPQGAQAIIWMLWRQFTTPDQNELYNSGGKGFASGRRPEQPWRSRSDKDYAEDQGDFTPTPTDKRRIYDGLVQREAKYRHTAQEINDQIEYDTVGILEKDYPIFIKSMRANKTNPGSLTFYSLDEYKQKGARLFKLKGIDAGFAIAADGDIISVHNSSNVKGLGKTLINLAIKEGGTKLDHFDLKPLNELYESAGFQEYERYPWNDEYKPENWDSQKFGEPSLILRRRSAQLKQPRKQLSAGSTAYLADGTKIKIVAIGNNIATVETVGDKYVWRANVPMQDLLSRPGAS